MGYYKRLYNDMSLFSEGYLKVGFSGISRQKNSPIQLKTELSTD